MQYFDEARYTDHFFNDDFLQEHPEFDSDHELDDIDAFNYDGDLIEDFDGRRIRLQTIYLNSPVREISAINFSCNVQTRLASRTDYYAYLQRNSPRIECTRPTNQKILLVCLMS